MKSGGSIFFTKSSASLTADTNLTRAIVIPSGARDLLFLAAIFAPAKNRQPFPILCV
jgi:hypothetical protein